MNPSTNLAKNIASLLKAEGLFTPEEQYQITSYLTRRILLPNGVLKLSPEMEKASLDCERSIWTKAPIRKYIKKTEKMMSSLIGGDSVQEQFLKDYDLDMMKMIINGSAKAAMKFPKESCASLILRATDTYMLSCVPEHLTGFNARLWIQFCVRWFAEAIREISRICDVAPMVSEADTNHVYASAVIGTNKIGFAPGVRHVYVSHFLAIHGKSYPTYVPEKMDNAEKKVIARMEAALKKLSS